MPKLVLPLSQVNELSVIRDGNGKVVSVPEFAPYFVAAANMLPTLIEAYENLEDQRPADAHCLECTAGTTPVRFGIRTCAYHEAKALLAKVQQ